MAGIAEENPMRSTWMIGLALLVGCSSSGEGPALIVGPAGANTFDDLFVEVDDDDPSRYTYSWAVDGEPLDDLTEPTVSADLTEKGEEWTVTVSRGNRSSTATIEIGNALPSAEVSIVPGNPTSNDAVTARGQASDPDGDPAFVEYRWAKYDAEKDAFEFSTITSTTLPATATSRGEVWRVYVTPDDGDDRGPEGYLEFTIQNGLPLVDRLELNRTTATTDTVLSVVAAATDPDEDRVTLEYQWVVNGAEVAGQTGNSFDGAASDGFDAGDEVYVKVRGNDGEAGPWRVSPTITVSNGAPTPPVAAVEPAEPLEDQDLRCVLVEPSTDTDPGDTVSYRAEWVVNGAPYLGGTTTTFTNDTIPAALTEPGDTWTCQLIAFDALGNQSMHEAAVVVDARSGCVDGTTEVSWNLDLIGCLAADPITWTEASTNTSAYCIDGWEMAGSDVVNSVLNGPGYTDDWEFAFDGEGCNGVDYYATTNDSRWRSERSCTWRRAHFTRLSSDTSEVDGVMCMRSPEEETEE